VAADGVNVVYYVLLTSGDVTSNYRAAVHTHTRPTGQYRASGGGRYVEPIKPND